MDAPLTLACALEIERRAARKGGAPAALVGLGAGLPLPAGPLVSFGFCGALVSGLEPGTLLTARRVVDGEGTVLWEGDALPVPGALRAVFCAGEGIASAPAERRALAERSGAVAVDLESGVLARTGRLAGAVRAVSDGAQDRIGRLASAGGRDGGTDWAVVVRAFVLEPLLSVRTARGARRALATLARAAEALR
jgi:adenosylhomocysteine nucleosidase